MKVLATVTDIRGKKATYTFLVNTTKGLFKEKIEEIILNDLKANGASIIKVRVH